MNLSTEETQLFYQLRLALLAYTNQYLKVIPQATTAEEVGKQPVEQVARLRDALHAKPELLERFVAENPTRFSAQELAIVASWRHRVSGDFYIMRHLKPYTVFMSGRGTPHLYGVLGLYDPLEEVTGGAPLPILVQATLLPFRDHIIYDGILSFYRIKVKVTRTQTCGIMGRAQQHKRRSAVHGQHNQALGSESTVHLQSRD
jgi:hypothetical protein